MCSANIDILQNSCSAVYQADCMIKIFEKYEVKKFYFSRVSGLQLATLIKTEHCHRHIVISLALM